MKILKLFLILISWPVLANSQGLWESFDANPDSLTQKKSSSSILIQSSSSELVLSSSNEVLSSSSQILISSSSSIITTLSSSSQEELSSSSLIESPISSSKIPTDQALGSSSLETSKPLEQDSPTPPVKQKQIKKAPTVFAPQPFKLNESKSDSIEPVKEVAKPVVFKVPFDKKPIINQKTPVTFVPLYEKKKGKYISPKVAGFSSLILPGLGQFRVPGNSLRGTAYFITEIALGVSLYYWGYKKQQDAIDEYTSLANQNFSKMDYENWSSDFQTFAQENNTSDFFESNINQSRGTWCRSIYGSEVAGVEDCLSRSSSHTQYIQNVNLKIENKEAYYKLISNETWVAGWSDAKANSFTAITDSKNSNDIGESKKQNEFKDARDDASFYASLRPWLISGLIFNHILSAIDAAYSADTNNQKLYKEPVMKTSLGLTPEAELMVTMNWSYSW